MPAVWRFARKNFIVKSIHDSLKMYRGLAQLWSETGRRHAGFAMINLPAPDARAANKLGTCLKAPELPLLHGV